MNYNKAKFSKSAKTNAQLPPSKAEVAFAGRSNAGKSSAINAITNIRGLARTSSTPGRTQLLNYFQIEDGFYLVDLPGYGYAAVAKHVQKEWEQSLTKYIEGRNELRGVVLIMDIRHPLTAYDQEMIHWVASYNIPMHILLTKSDKIKRNPAKLVLEQVQKQLIEFSDLITMQLFSAQDGTGLDAARAKLDEWLV